jgi:hypothetical protein
MRYLMITAMLLLLTCTEAVAKSVIVYGYGSSSCGAWLEAREFAVGDWEAYPRRR